MNSHREKGRDKTTHQDRGKLKKGQGGHSPPQPTERQEVDQERRAVQDGHPGAVGGKKQKNATGKNEQQT